MAFAHLHLHSQYSLLDGAIQEDHLAKRIQEIGQTAVALTDHGWIAGALKLTKECRKNDIKPIIGAEVYMATQKSRFDKADNPGDNHHLTLLAKNRRGYENLVRLTSEAHLTGFYYKPRIDKALLAECSEGIMVMTGCVAAELPQLLAYGREAEAQALVEWYTDTFGEDVFIELMFHGATEGIDHVQIEDSDGGILMAESELNDALVAMAERYSVPLIATNDAHYLTQQDGVAHDVLLCMQMGKHIEVQDRMRFPGAEHNAWEFYVKDEEEMRAASSARYWDQACDNTAEVASRVEMDIIRTGDTILPGFTVPDSSEFDLWLKAGVII